MKHCNKLRPVFRALALLSALALVACGTNPQASPTGLSPGPSEQAVLTAPQTTRANIARLAFATTAGAPVVLPFGADWLEKGCDGQLKRHTGIDIAVPSGAPVYAAEAGTVRLVGQDSRWKGWITIQHEVPGGIWTSVYWHLNPQVRAGQRVSRGEVIATVAKMVDGKGRDNTHLHFGVRDAPYSNVANRGALPRTRSCGPSDPVYPEAFKNPQHYLVSGGAAAAPPDPGPGPVPGLPPGYVCSYATVLKVDRPLVSGGPVVIIFSTDHPLGADKTVEVVVGYPDPHQGLAHVWVGGVTGNGAGTASIDAGRLAPGRYTTLLLKAKDRFGNWSPVYERPGAGFIVDRTKPRVTAFYAVVRGQTAWIVFSTDDDSGSDKIAWVRVGYADPFQGLRHVWIGRVDGYGAGSFQVDLRGLVNGRYPLIVEAEDAAGNRTFRQEAGEYFEVRK